VKKEDQPQHLWTGKVGDRQCSVSQSQKPRFVTNTVSVHDVVLDVESVVPLWKPEDATHKGSGRVLKDGVPGVDDVPKVDGTVADEDTD